MKLIVGLGNPEKKYENTRHNTGFMVIDAIAKECKTELKQEKFQALIETVNVGGEKVILAKPLTYMNNSGLAVRMIMDFYKISNKEICVIYDDMDMPCGKLRLREKGSAGGHNGIKSIIAHLGVSEFARIRVGIDKPIGDTIDYVLGRFNAEQKELMDKGINKAAKAALEFCNKPFSDVMNIYNRNE